MSMFNKRPLVNAFKMSLSEVLNMPESKISMHRTSYECNAYANFEEHEVDQIRHETHAKVSYEIRIGGQYFVDLHCDHGGSWKSYNFPDDGMDQSGFVGIDQICRRAIRFALIRHVEQYNGKDLKEVMELSR